MLLALLLLAAPKIAVLDVRVGAGIDPALGPYLAQVLAREVADRTGAAPLVSADVTAMLGFEKKKRMLGCSDEDASCLAEITGALGVQNVLAASVAFAEGRYLLTLSLLDARRALPLKRAAESAAHNEESLVYALRRGAWHIFGGPEPEQPGWGRRQWAGLAFAGATALALGGGVAGVSALSAAKDGDSATARPRSHLADLLFATALAGAGVGAYLWVSGAPVQLSAAALPNGALAQVRW